ncbi:orotidine-5'-phosphate decarboxylase [Oceanobacillus profundus]|uniref:Orotidine 5'-phosphate decarboxylase n=1 Tax=Oceanobacillus profundus TaxID=372463 RepID=A0A417YK85_9BACI|nr:orotidine-5'-phosphate decarboxylase [Oceanobacillus profundus]MBR3119457.1 orotidine-5'-phosphate decarboxylase [Oceanobacillus sp.]MDO6449715.1 orotidine-5'-phosphate decarboxylase [Oceanobacillus profundus]PAE30112.1 orotidine-5'-phosphate decarboxylase [Paenibacillus sp. 7884-2]RHW33717.1 orotidine-5'-phosphate decarboxylase [Oceanobacillus profundus]
MKEKIYLALDFPNWQATKQFLDNNQLYGIPVKVGMELFYHEGPAVIKKLKERNHPIFLDLKLHDIPTTVMRAMRNIASLGVDMVNVHALGGGEMIRYAKEGLVSSNNEKIPKLIAVTILTSMEQQTLNEQLRISGNVVDNAAYFAAVAHDNGADGVVCSVHEAMSIKALCGDTFLTVTPGIRLADSDKNDQKRIATPSFAKDNGSDYIVVGRSVTKSSNPYEAYQQIVEEWKHGIKG